MKRLLLLAALAVVGCKYWYKPVPVANAIGEDTTVLAGDTMHVYRDDRFEVYGPDEQAVYDGYEQMDRAYRAFERHFGAATTRIAVLLASDTSLVIDSATPRSFSARGFTFVRYVRPKPEYMRYGTLAYGGIMWPVAPTAARIMLARFAKSQLAADTSITDAAALARFPVWYRAAIMHLIGEPGSISNDIEYLHDQRSAWLPLQELLTLVRSPADDAALDPSRRNDADATSRLVAAQAATVAQYLVQKDGPSTMRRIAQGYMSGESTTQILADIPSASHGLPHFEQNWHVWVETQDQ